MSPELLVREWQCVELYQNDELQEMVSGSIRIEFREDRSYTYKAGLHEESGKWTISDNMLQTEAADKTTKEIEILELNDSTLLLDVNQMGTSMRMKLVSEEYAGI